jgi:hypothetical protein
MVGFHVRADNWGGDVAQELGQFIKAPVEFMVAKGKGIVTHFIYGIADLFTTVEGEEEGSLYCFHWFCESTWKEKGDFTWNSSPAFKTTTSLVELRISLIFCLTRAYPAMHSDVGVQSVPRPARHSSKWA